MPQDLICTCPADVNHMRELCDFCQDEYARLRRDLESQEEVLHEMELVEFHGRRAA